MSIEEDINAIAALDQTDAAMRAMAKLVAVYWKTLVKQGLQHADATELTRPIVIKMLGGEPE